MTKPTCRDMCKYMRHVRVEGFEYLDSGLAGNAIARLDYVAAGMVGAVTTAIFITLVSWFI